MTSSGESSPSTIEGLPLRHIIKHASDGVTDMADWRPMLIRRNDGFPRIMGVLNITPDSFHEESRLNSTESAVTRAVGMVEQGADWIDIGGESTRPGAIPVNAEEEAARVVPIVRAVREALPKTCISIDTRRSSVASRALDAGADLVNDVSALSDPEMADLVANRGCPICVMHMQGTPEDMQNNPSYQDVVDDIRNTLGKALSMLTDLGVDSSMIVADPGIGFGKTLEHNLSLLASGRDVVPDHRMPLMWGVSRKSMFFHLLNRESTDDRLAGSLGVAARAKDKGVDIIRVHDVAEHADLFAAMDALR
ncbi:MAG: dihydropteroate synthase [Euryarchaeota archaeon]|nr:dihydropteroate synthase [Euryarchaeota archaeon]